MAATDLIQEGQKVLSQMLQNLFATIGVLTRDARTGSRVTIWRTGQCSVRWFLGSGHAFSVMVQSVCVPVIKSV